MVQHRDALFMSQHDFAPPRAGLFSQLHKK